MRKLTIFPALLAIGCLITVSCWWFVQLSTLPRLNTATVSNVSLQAVRTVLLLQLLSISLFAPLWAGNLPTRQPASARIVVPVLSAVFPAWPLLALLWLATGISAAVVTKTEAFVFAAGLGVSLLAFLIQRLALHAEITRLLQASLGLVATITAWLFRDEWLQWIIV